MLSVFLKQMFMKDTDVPWDAVFKAKTLSKCLRIAEVDVATKVSD